MLAYEWRVSLPKSPGHRELLPILHFFHPKLGIFYPKNTFGRTQSTLLTPQSFNLTTSSIVWLKMAERLGRHLVLSMITKNLISLIDVI
jgi:hypothetical protein